MLALDVCWPIVENLQPFILSIYSFGLNKFLQRSRFTYAINPFWFYHHCINVLNQLCVQSSVLFYALVMLWMLYKKIIYQFASTHKFAYCFSIDSMRCGDLLYPIQFTTCILRKQCRAMWPRYSRSPLTILTNLQSKYVRIYGVTSVVGIRKNKVLSLIFPTARFTRSISPLQERSFVCCML